jgi:regulator of protease activity HflC (stomatin/prohibitin superfamily)
MPLTLLRRLTLWLIGYEAIWRWTICRVYVEKGESLVLTYRGPLIGSVPSAAPGRFAKVDESGNPLERGVLEEMLGPGRHFVSPWHFDRVIVKDVVVPVGKVAVVTSKVGEDPPTGSFLIDDEPGKAVHKGILRKVLTPGRYRLNTFSAYDVPATPDKMDDAVVVPPGSVGVVTNLADNPLTGEKQGVQDKTLPAGTYFLNPREKRVEIVQVGLWAVDVAVSARKDSRGRDVVDKDDEPVYDGGITFPSNDGFPIRLDATAIWGVHPRDAAGVVREFGNVDKIERNLVLPQLNSICRIQGSAMSAVELVVGETREQFQKRFSEEFQRVCKTRHVQLEEALIRHIYAPLMVRKPIQAGKIADEVKKTRDQEQETARKEAELEEAKQKVTLEEKRVDAETAKESQQALALGVKRVKEMDAETQRAVAKLDAKTAEIEAETERILGEARAEVERMVRRAEADRFRQAVSAFRGGEAYNRWVFASGLPDSMDLRLIFAGPGTLWTDLPGIEAKLMGKSLTEPTRK